MRNILTNNEFYTLNFDTNYKPCGMKRRTVSNAKYSCMLILTESVSVFQYVVCH